MTLAEFLSLGIQREKKYKVRLRLNNRQEPKEYELFFWGFRFFAMKSHGLFEDDIYPVFNEQTKNGKMSNKHFMGIPTWTRNIISILPCEEKDYDPVMTKEELKGLSAVATRVEVRAKFQFERLIAEMAVLFPGKKIIFDPDARFCGTHYYKHGCETVDIDAVGAGKDGKPVFDISGEYDNEKDVPAFNIDPGSWAELLETTIEAIESPWFEDKEEEQFIKENTPFGDVPYASKAETPVLMKLGCLEILRCNLWFSQLPFEKKREILARYMDKKETDTIDDFSADAIFTCDLNDGDKLYEYVVNEEIPKDKS